MKQQIKIFTALFLALTTMPVLAQEPCYEGELVNGKCKCDHTTSHPTLELYSKGATHYVKYNDKYDQCDERIYLDAPCIHKGHSDKPKDYQLENAPEKGYCIVIGKEYKRVRVRELVSEFNAKYNKGNGSVKAGEKILIVKKTKEITNPTELVDEFTSVGKYTSKQGQPSVRGILYEYNKLCKKNGDGFELVRANETNAVYYVCQGTKNTEDPKPAQAQNSKKETKTGDITTDNPNADTSKTSVAKTEETTAVDKKAAEIQKAKDKINEAIAKGVVVGSTINVGKYTVEPEVYPLIEKWEKECKKSAKPEGAKKLEIGSGANQGIYGRKCLIESCDKGYVLSHDKTKCDKDSGNADSGNNGSKGSGNGADGSDYGVELKRVDNPNAEPIHVAFSGSENKTEKNTLHSLANTYNEIVYNYYQIGLPIGTDKAVFKWNDKGTTRNFKNSPVFQKLRDNYTYLCNKHIKNDPSENGITGMRFSLQGTKGICDIDTCNADTHKDNPVKGECVPKQKTNTPVDDEITPKQPSQKEINQTVNKFKEQVRFGKTIQYPATHADNGAVKTAIKDWKDKCKKAVQTAHGSTSVEDDYIEADYDSTTNSLKCRIKKCADQNAHLTNDGKSCVQEENKSNEDKSQQSRSASPAPAADAQPESKTPTVSVETEIINAQKSDTDACAYEGGTWTGTTCECEDPTTEEWDPVNKICIAKQNDPDISVETETLETEKNTQPEGSWMAQPSSSEEPKPERQQQIGQTLRENTSVEAKKQNACEKLGGKWANNGKVSTCVCPNQANGEFWDSEKLTCVVEDEETEIPMQVQDIEDVKTRPETLPLPKPEEPVFAPVSEPEVTCEDLEVYVKDTTEVVRNAENEITEVIYHTEVTYNNGMENCSNLKDTVSEKCPTGTKSEIEFKTGANNKTDIVLKCTKPETNKNQIKQECDKHKGTMANNKCVCPADNNREINLSESDDICEEKNDADEKFLAEVEKITQEFNNKVNKTKDKLCKEQVAADADKQ